MLLPPLALAGPSWKTRYLHCLQFLQQLSLASYTFLCFRSCQHLHILVVFSLCNPLICAPGRAGIYGALDTSFFLIHASKLPMCPPLSGSPSGTRTAGTLSGQSPTLVPWLQMPLPSTSTASGEAFAPSLSEPPVSATEANPPQ